MTSAADFADRFRGLIGVEAVETGAGVRAFKVDGQLPQSVLFPRSVEELSACVRAASEAGLATIPVGNGTQLAIGRNPSQYDIAISTRRLRRILEHAAADMTVSVEAGLTLAELNAALRSAGQQLPLDPPHPDYTTIGALIATNSAGPSRLSQGTVRDLLIGIKVVLADGRVITGGGRVVKNVAGYDMMKLFTGSFGTLGIVVEANFKVRPLPEQEAVFVLPAPTTAAACSLARRVLAAPITPLWVEVLNHVTALATGIGESAAVAVGCGGSAAEISVQQERLRECGDDRPLRSCTGAEQRQLTGALRDFPDSVLGRVSHEARPLPAQDVNSVEGVTAGTGPISPVPTLEQKLELWRDLRRRASADICGCTVSLLPAQLGDVLPRIEAEAGRRAFESALLAHAGAGVALWCFRGAAIADGGLPPFADWLRTAVRAANGWVVFDSVPEHAKDRIEPWDSDVPGLPLMRGIKQALDPARRLSPGRFVGGI